jgi:hypothetical protein
VNPVTSSTATPRSADDELAMMKTSIHLVNQETSKEEGEEVKETIQFSRGLILISRRQVLLVS